MARSHLGTRLLDFLLRCRCLGCGAPDCLQDNICADCYGRLHTLTGSVCWRCGHALHRWEDASNNGCVYCPSPFAVDATCCCVAYHDLAKELIVRFKKNAALSVGRFWGRWMSRCHTFDAMWQQHPHWIMAPVPVHWWRLWQRGFNQSVELGRHITYVRRNMHWVPDLLIAKRQSAAQKKLGAAQRMLRHNPFCVRSRYSVKGKVICLVEDVVTTGTTIHQCAEALKKEGATYVGVAAIARTLHPHWKMQTS